MNILSEIHRSHGVPTQGRTVYRAAVRGVIESHAQALRREIQEECGMAVAHIGSEIGAVIEYDIPAEKDFDIFKMTSHYYECAVQDGFGTQQLDKYEQELGFKPVWIEVDEAIQQNKALRESETIPDWLRREIFVLEYIQQRILSTLNT
jgi:8-oxo-dGTP pyrophosphatase MutT (NUDIX family)